MFSAYVLKLTERYRKCLGVLWIVEKNWQSGAPHCESGGEIVSFGFEQ